MRSKKRGCSLRMSLPTMIRRSARFRVSVRVDVVQPALCSTLTLRYCPSLKAWSTTPPARSASASAARMPSTPVASPPNRGLSALPMSAAASLTASASVTSLPLICGLLGGSLRSKPPIARPQPFLRTFSVPSSFSTSRSSHSMPQNGQATFSNTFCISRSPAALRALEFCMPLEPHHKAREESTGGTATQLQGRNLSPLAVAQIGQDSKLRCSRGRPARHRPRPRLCCGRDLNNLERRPCPRAMAVWPTFSGFC